jgi:hypothetical protein
MNKTSQRLPTNEDKSFELCQLDAEQVRVQVCQTLKERP